MIFGRKQEPSSYVTLYKGEDVHPKIADVWEWADANIFSLLPTDSKGKTVLAGGALRSFFTDTRVTDFDLYFRDLKAYDAMVNLTVYSPWHNVPTASKTSVIRQHAKIDNEGLLKSYTVNLIRDPIGETADQIISRFDFTVCMCAVTPEMIIYHPDYFTDLATRTLRINYTGDSIRTLWRIQKYNGYGFTIGKEDLWQLIEATHDMASLPKVVKDEKAIQPGEIPLVQIFGSS